MPVRRRFRPTLGPTIFTIPALAVLVGLGVWQLDRLQWKTALIAAFEQRVSAAAVAPPNTVDDIEQWRYRRVSATGRFLHDREIQITGKPFEGSAGFHVVTPLEIADGRILLVNRGWVPDNRRLPASRPDTLLDGQITVDGIFREDGRRGYFVPDNEPNKNVWLYVDSAEIAESQALHGVLPYYIDAIRSSGPRRLPIGAVTVISFRNEHLQYAATWFLLAVALAVIYVIYHYSSTKEPD